MNDATQADKLSGLGFNILVKLAEVEGLGGVPRTSMTVTQAFADANPNTVLALTAMYYEANLIWRAHPDIAAEAWTSLCQGRCRRDEEGCRLCPGREGGNRSTASAIRRSWSSRSRPCSRQIRTWSTVDASKAGTNKFLEQAHPARLEARPGRNGAGNAPRRPLAHDLARLRPLEAGQIGVQAAWPLPAEDEPDDRGAADDRDRMEPAGEAGKDAGPDKGGPARPGVARQSSSPRAVACWWRRPDPSWPGPARASGR